MFGQNNNGIYNTPNYYGAVQPPPQPSGMIYQVQNAMEVNNIPVGAGVIAALNMQDNLLYLKTLNNNIPTVAAFKLTPYTEPVKPATTEEPTSLEQRLNNLEKQMSSLIAALNKNEPKAAKTPAPLWET